MKFHVKMLPSTAHILLYPRTLGVPYNLTPMRARNYATAQFLMTFENESDLKKVASQFDLMDLPNVNHSVSNNHVPVMQLGVSHSPVSVIVHMIEPGLPRRTHILKVSFSAKAVMGASESLPVFVTHHATMMLEENVVLLGRYQQLKVPAGGNVLPALQNQLDSDDEFNKNFWELVQYRAARTSGN